MKSSNLKSSGSYVTGCKQHLRDQDDNIHNFVQLRLFHDCDIYRFHSRYKAPNLKILCDSTERLLLFFFFFFPPFWACPQIHRAIYKKARSRTSYSLERAFLFPALKSALLFLGCSLFLAAGLPFIAQVQCVFPLSTHSLNPHLHLVRYESRTVSSSMPLRLSADTTRVREGWALWPGGPETVMTERQLACAQWTGWNIIWGKHWKINVVGEDLLESFCAPFKSVSLSPGWASWHGRPLLSRYDQVNCLFLLKDALLLFTSAVPWAVKGVDNKETVSEH